MLHFITDLYHVTKLVADDRFVCSQVLLYLCKNRNYMEVYPNAKINIGLNIVAKRTDGYHDLETVFYPIDLHDVLSLERTVSEKTTLTIDGIKIEGTAEDNLVMRAYRLLEHDFQLPAVSMRLTKNIPSQAGLGGGSSDAAFTLKALNKLFALKLDEKQLETYASKLGADCPFFIKNHPVYAEGTGNIFTQFDLSLRNNHLVLIKPDIYISTKEAFQHVFPRITEKKLTTLLKEPFETWKTSVKNDFEDSVFPSHPLLAEIKSRLYDLGAVYASMSGSGSSLYAIFIKPLKDIEIHFHNCFCKQIRLR